MGVLHSEAGQTNDGISVRNIVLVAVRVEEEVRNIEHENTAMAERHDPFDLVLPSAEDEAVRAILGVVLVWLVRAPPPLLRRGGTVAEAGSAWLLLQILGFFAYAGSFVFGRRSAACRLRARG